MGPRIVRGLIGAFIGILLAGGLFAAGVATGMAAPGLQDLLRASPLLPLAGESTPQAPSPTAAAPGSAVEQLFSPFWQAWSLVHEKFVDQPLDDTLLMQGAIRGLIGALDDPNSSYMDPSEYEQANLPLVGSYDGIGAYVDSEAEYLTIIAPMPGSPAERVGLQPGDEVVAIDGEDMTGIDPSLAIQRILGPAGTTVRLTILRPGETDTFEVEVERAHIDLPNVESEMLDPGIGYVRLYTFGTNTDLELRQALEGLMAHDPQGLILDLRGNGGGYLSSAISVASEFIGDGVVMVERYGDGREEVFQAEPGGAATEIPLVVLIDGGSASASEIVAGAIQDRGRGLLVGETSYGKGSVQEWIPLTSDSGAVRVTVARWLTPSRRQIDEVGLSPDVAAERTDEDLQAQRDPQLDRAIEVLLGEVAQ
jgi:carboxyl-terminal processing protease